MARSTLPLLPCDSHDPRMFHTLHKIHSVTSLTSGNPNTVGNSGEGLISYMEEVPISCAEVRWELSNYVDGEVSVELRMRIDAHVNGCGGCRAIYDGIRNVISLVGMDGIIELPRGLSQRLYQRLRPN
jgi:hypothetical protein